MMDEAVRKVLRRACARFKTGIRTPFRLGEHTARIDQHDVSRAYDDGVCYDDGEDETRQVAILVIWPVGTPVSGAQSFTGLEEVTPEAVHGAYLQAIVDQVHAL